VLSVLLVLCSPVSGAIVARPRWLRLRGGDDGGDDLTLPTRGVGQLSKSEITQMLNRVPTFCIMEPDGSVISLPDRDGQDGDECCTWFIDAGEAQLAFKRVVAANPDVTGLHLRTFGLGDAFTMCNGWPDSPQGTHDLKITGTREVVSQCKVLLAEALQKAGFDGGSWTLPVFIGEELARTGESGEQMSLPIFLSPHHLRATYERVGVGKEAMQKGPKALDLRMLVAQMAAATNEIPNPWRAVEFVAQPEAVELANKLVGN